MHGMLDNLANVDAVIHAATEYDQRRIQADAGAMQEQQQYKVRSVQHLMSDGCGMGLIACVELAVPRHSVRGQFCRVPTSVLDQTHCSAMSVRLQRACEQ